MNALGTKAHQCLRRRYLSSSTRRLAAATAESSTSNPDKAYSKTLLLPKTSFPLWSEPSKREVPLRKRTCDDLYRWQWENAKGPLFVLHDGPPYANGDLHMGHALNKILKDIINRYHVLLGHRVHYVPGWDCHGLPIENKALKRLRKDPLKLPPGVVRAEALKYAHKEVEKQREEFKQLGIMADWDNPSSTYRTIDHDYMLRQLRIFQRMIGAGLIHRAHRPVYYSPSSRSALAEAELEYDDIISHSVYVSFTVPASAGSVPPLLRELMAREKVDSIGALVWTTTPWTLTANMGIAVNEGMTYTVLRQKKTGQLLLVAKDRLSALEKDDILGHTVVLADIPGKDLVGVTYKPLFGRSQPFVYKIHPSAHVSPNTGTGFVHCAPAHGMEDYHLFRSLNLLPRHSGMLCHVDALGKFSPEVVDVVGHEAGRSLVGLQVLRDGGRVVIDILGDKIVWNGKLKHRYPIDWKTKEPVIIMATEQWFANLNNIKDAAVTALKDVDFYPTVSRNRLESFVNTRSEWCISRQRVWGMPIPALYNDQTGETLLTEQSLEHILSVIDNKGIQHWWDGPVEDFVPLSRAGEKGWRKGTETMDVWFDSGSSWSMLEGLGESRQHLADVCVEGSDQHRGWFQSQLLTKVAVSQWHGTETSVAPYGTLITHGMVLDQEGKKMSKTLGNIVSPMVVVNGGKDKKKEPAYGADALRLWAATVEYWRDAALGPTVLAQAAESLRKIRNTARFILGNVYNGFGGEWERVERKDLGLAERYVMYELYKVEQAAMEGYASYNFPKAVNALSNFANITMSSLYFDITKDCLYAEKPESQSRRAVATVLEQVLKSMTKAVAPVLPHLAEEIHANIANLERVGKAAYPSFQSVFMEPWVPLSVEWRDPQAEEDMNVLLRARSEVLLLLEKARGEKHLRNSLEAEVDVVLPDVPSSNISELVDVLRRESEYLKTLFIVSDVTVTDKASLGVSEPTWIVTGTIPPTDSKTDSILLRVRPSSKHKCPRCWTYTRPAEDLLCARCTAAIPSS
ncbi:isoleucyl-tRNA synthetase [Punctularia strigosozonata HHB-11173 SS5]|uniref:isoleucyl-tRNA synthetase n=1 Tax=Punctularia strigosozonata (strain HHB-11173) TaxID=741275 RepID=UPI0004417467|nr:isoleucyl-tRNA synthetase [Punctularia strigosozonata HHB-11173 SS5]EIN08861.1 isoleucyl-tRNA synthetase [Punctularia strigosozonata HHB-11173 SS5]